jgi:pyruvate dehydrogenase E2 component (dihydrolipoamide acetyltransferase)
MGLLQEIKVPLIAVNDTTLSVVEINFSTGDRVKKGDIVLVFETSKTTYDVVAESDGYIQYQCEAGNDYEVNDVVAAIFSEQSEMIAGLKPASKPVAAVAAPAKKKEEIFAVKERIVPGIQWEGDTLFSAEASRLITASGVDSSLFAGKDFVSKQDVEGLLKTPAPAQKSKPVPPVDHSKVIIEKLSSNKRREIEYLSDVQSTGLTSTINTIVETEGIFVHLNRSLKYIKNSLLPVIIYETGRLLQKFPALNGYFTGNSIAYYNQVNVGFAIDIDKGLKVLKIEKTAEKSMADIEADIMDLSSRYLEDTLQVENLTEITFTITDLSSEGVAFFRPLVNMMNSGILGVSAIDDKLQRCTLSLTFDHRVTEGKLVAQFLNELKNRLESYRAKNHSYPVKDIVCYKCTKSLADDLADVGFVKSITPQGKEGYLCQSCLKGF